MAEISTSTIKNRPAREQISSLDAVHSGFANLMDGLKDAVTRFQDQSTPESFAQIITALGAFGLSGAEIFRDVTDYTKKHPVRVAFAVGLTFFALKGLLGQSEKLEGSLH